MEFSHSPHMSPGMRFFFARIFPWCCVAGAGVALGFGYIGVIRARDSVDWPLASGIVTRSTVESRYDSDHTTTYRAEIRYEFVVDGETIEGSRVAYGDYGSSNSSHAWGLVKRYPRGKHVTVHYMPGNPQECLLEPGVKPQTWFLPGFGLALLAIGSTMFLFPDLLPPVRTEVRWPH